MIKHTSSQRSDTIFSLLAFSAFAMAVLMTLMLGVSFYQRMTEMSDDGYDERTCLSYVWTKIKNSDHIDKVSVSDFNGIPAIALYEVYGEYTYMTRIYPYDGWVYELFSEVGFDMSPEDGTPIIKADSLHFAQMENGLIEVSSGSGRMLIHPRGKAGIVRGSDG